MKAKKKSVSVTNPDELNKHLQHTSFLTWIILGLISVILIGFFSWSFIYKFEIKLLGKADIADGEVIFDLKKNDLEKLKVGQIIYILDKKGEILSFDNNGQPKASHFELENGNYEYKIIIEEKRPADFLFGK